MKKDFNYLSKEVQDWIKERKGHPDPAFNPTCYYSCLFKTSDLMKHAKRNEINANNKLIIALERLKVEPLTMESFPILSLDCVSGEMCLIEGNNRLIAFLTLGYTWFPVIVAIVQTPGSEQVREIPEQYLGTNDWDNASLWRHHEADIISDVYELETK